jgi:RNA polymerase sigma-70 factor, ECF subfamily
MKVSENELKALLAQGLAGDPEAYRRFLEAVDELLRKFVARHVHYRLRRHELDVEDIVQDALIAIHGKRHTYDGETPVTAWAYAIARYKLIDTLRASKVGSDLASLDELGKVIDERSSTEARLVIEKMMATLPKTLRLPLELTKLHGFSAGEAALQTGTSEATVRVNVHRGLRALSSLCKPVKETDDGKR